MNAVNGIDPSFILEIFNGVACILTGWFMAFLLVYIVRQPERLYEVDGVLGIPVRFEVAVALFVSTAGAFTTRAVVYLWRFSGAGPFDKTQTGFLMLGVVFYIVGMLCSIRVFSKPFYGHWPWLSAAGMSLLFAVATIVFRG